MAGNTARPNAKDAIDEQSKSEFSAVSSPTKAIPRLHPMCEALLLRIQQSEEDSTMHCSNI